jgi:uncharacterized repeat protein (TIGR01451 family)
MRYHIRCLCLVLAITLIFLIPVESELNDTCNCTQTPEPPAMIEVSSEVYEINSTTFAVFGNNSIEPAKQELYKINVTNNGNVPLSDVIVSIASADGMIFKNIAYYDNAGNLDDECNQHDLCEWSSPELMTVGTLNSNETKSILINAYLKPEVEKRQIEIESTGIKPNGSVSDTQDIAELAKCVVACNNETDCKELFGRCICKRPDWIDQSVASNLPTKPQIELKEIKVTNEISAIRTASQVWSNSNVGNVKYIESYVPNVADQVTYQITVSNQDDINSLKDVSIVDLLPNGMIYVSSSLKIEGQSSGDQIRPVASGNNITWSIDVIAPNTKVLINNTAAFLNNDFNQFENKVYAKGTWDTKYVLIIGKSQTVSSVIPV